MTTIASGIGQMRAIRDFGERGGQLRISLTSRCQIGCWFCHNEGEIPPRLTHQDRSIQPRRPALGVSEILNTIEAMVGAGIRRVFFTGGEPLVSSLTRPVLTGLPEAGGVPYATTLITNGLRLKKDLPWLRETRLDHIKVSLHYFSDESYKVIANGGPGGVAIIREAIEAAVEAYGPDRVGLNMMLHEANRHELASIVGYAVQLGIGLQVIELVDTSHNAGLGGDRVTAQAALGLLRKIASSERVNATGTGQMTREFRVGRSTIEVIDATLGRYHVGQCASCPVKAECVEGFWALRLEAAGSILPCLLRRDLELDVRSLFADPAQLAGSIGRHVDAFVEGRL